MRKEKEMRYLKKEYIGKIIRITPIGYKRGIRYYCVDYADCTSEDYYEHEIEKFFV